MIRDIKEPDTDLTRRAKALVRTVSSDVLFNHVMRSYWFAELFAQQEGVKLDSELVFLSSVLHDLGLTEHVSGPHRFEIEGAGAARQFLTDAGMPAAAAQKVWDNIALHTWDHNFYRGDDSRLMQLGLAYDVTGAGDRTLDAADVADVLARFPRLQFKRVFNEILNDEVDRNEPYEHWFHICSRVAHNRSPLTIVDVPALLEMAPFTE